MANKLPEVKVPLQPGQRPQYIERDMYIVDLEVRDESNNVGYQYLKIQYVPAELTYTPESNWAVIPSVGRNNPFYHYTGSEDILQFTLDWHADDILRLKVIENCKWVEALSKADGYTKEPHVVKLIWGDLFQDSLWIVEKAPYRLVRFQALGMRPVQAYQDVTLKRVINHNRTRSEILNPYS